MNTNHKRTCVFFCLITSAICIAQALAVPVDKTIVVPDKGGSIVEGFQLIAQADSNAFAPSTPIIITVALKNTTDKVLAAPVSNPVADYNIEVTNLQGEVLPLTRYGQRRMKNRGTIFGIGLMEIAPGKELKETFVINRFFDMTENEEYVIKFVKKMVPKLNKSGWVSIESNAIRLKVDNSIKYIVPTVHQATDIKKDKITPTHPNPK